MDEKPTQATADTESSDLARATIPAALGKPEIPAVPLSDAAQPGTPVPIADESQARFAEETHRYIREFIRIADRKAAFFFTAATALLAFLYSEEASVWWRAPIPQWGSRGVISFLAMLLLVIGDVLLLIVVLPSLKGSKRGIIFFDAIAECETGKDYRDEVVSKNLAELVHTKLQHVWELARLCRQKYRYLTWGCWTAAAGAVFCLIYLMVASPQSPSGPRPAVPQAVQASEPAPDNAQPKGDSVAPARSAAPPPKH
jgi:hypothetical protein